MNNPAGKAVKILGGPAAVGEVVGMSRQAVNSWSGSNGAPVYFIRSLSIASGVPITEFLAFEEAKKGIKAESLAKALKNNADDRK